MKESWFVFNEISGSYIYYEGKEEGQRHNRQEIFEQDFEKLKKKLEHLVNPKRTSLLHLKDLSEEVVFKIEDFYKDSKVEVDY